MLKVDDLFLEFYDERSGGFEPLQHVNRIDLQIVLGLITSKFSDLENPETIKARIAQAAEYVGLDQYASAHSVDFPQQKKAIYSRRTAVG